MQKNKSFWQRFICAKQDGSSAFKRQPENVNDDFGDNDDDFDLLLSQIDTTEAVQSSSTFTILSEKTLQNYKTR